MNIEDLRSKNSADLHKELYKLQKEQFAMRMQKSIGEFNKTHLIKKLRRNVAQIKTIINSKK